MAELKDFLGKFKKLLENEFIQKDILLKVINKILNVDLTKDDIVVKKNILYVKSNIYLKSEISLKKSLILKEIKKEGIENIKDIK